MELLNKTVFAIASAIIAAGVGWYSYHQQELGSQREQLNTEKQLALSKQVQASTQSDAKFKNTIESLQQQLRENDDDRTTISFFMNTFPTGPDDKQALLKVGVLGAYCNKHNPQNAVLKGTGPAQQFQPNGIVSFLCGKNQELAGGNSSAIQNSARTQAADFAKQDNPLGFLQEPVAVAQNLQLAATESSPTTPTTGWFAVIASLPLKQDPDVVASFARAMNGKLGAVVNSCDIRIYETVISKNYALTSGGVKTKEYADGRVRLLRAHGFPDAFVQANRGWKEATSIKVTRRQTPPCE